MTGEKRGMDLLRDSATNKSTAFTREERDAYGLRGLLPYAVNNQDKQVQRIMGNLRRKESNLERYILLSALQDRNERLFFRTVLDHLEEILPIIYTPTVGQACKEFSHIFRHTQGFYINPDDRGSMDKVMQNWPNRDVRVIVVTDGSRILGLGDLGANGMGIPIGKLSLYCACAGIHPDQCLPVMMDVGTNTEDILHDPLYLGYPQHRLTGEAYYDMLEEFVQAVQKNFPNALIQFEDFATEQAYALLHKYQNRILCFNDDIQGTASVALAGVFASTRITGKAYRDLKIMFLGAGSAATGIGDLMVRAFEEEGLSHEEAKHRLWFADAKGLVVASRTDLAEHKLPFAHEHPQMTFIEALVDLKPDVLIGATAKGGTFDKSVVELMCTWNERPVIFALSNPTDRAECTAEEAYKWSNGRVVFASGSPFQPVEVNGRMLRPGQGNNAYIFPGVGLGAIIAKARHIPDDIFLIAARTLAGLVPEEAIAQGALYPTFREIRHISLNMAEKVAESLYEKGLAQAGRPQDLREAISNYMYNPLY